MITDETMQYQVKSEPKYKQSVGPDQTAVQIAVVAMQRAKAADHKALGIQQQWLT